MENIDLQLNIILIRSKYARNIGASARAAANMGVSQIYLIDPQCEIDNEARMAAAGAQQMLSSVQVFKDFQSLLKQNNCGLRMALTRRPGKLRQNDTLPSLLHKIQQDGSNTDLSSISLIFGPEDHGLSNSDMEFAHCRCELPIYGEFKSLNLAQAVLLACSITQQRMADYFPKVRAHKQPIASMFPEKIIEEWLLTLGFNLSARRNNAFIVLKRLLLSSVPTEKEVSVLSSVIQQTIRILKSKNS